MDTIVPLTAPAHPDLIAALGSLNGKIPDGALNHLMNLHPHLAQWFMRGGEPRGSAYKAPSAPLLPGFEHTDLFHEAQAKHGANMAEWRDHHARTVPPGNLWIHGGAASLSLHDAATGDWHEVHLNNGEPATHKVSKAPERQAGVLRRKLSRVGSTLGTNMKHRLLMTRRILEQAGVAGSPLPVLAHDDATGTRPDVMVASDTQVHPAVLRYLAAYHGLLHGAPNVVAFNAHPTGPDKVHVIHCGVETQQIVSTLRQAGFPKFSVAKNVAYLFDPSGGADMTPLLGALRASQYHAVAGHGRIVGAGEGADAGDRRAHYRDAIRHAESVAASAATGGPQEPAAAPLKLGRIAAGDRFSENTPAHALLDYADENPEDLHDAHTRDALHAAHYRGEPVFWAHHPVTGKLAAWRPWGGQRPFGYTRGLVHADDREAVNEVRATAGLPRLHSLETPVNGPHGSLLVKAYRYFPNDHEVYPLDRHDSSMGERIGTHGSHAAGLAAAQEHAWGPTKLATKVEAMTVSRRRGDHRYRFETSEGHKYKVTFDELADGHHEVSFDRGDTGDVHATGDVGTGAHEVFASVRNALDHFMTTQTPTALKFVATKKEPTRVKLYHTAAKLIARHHGMDLETAEDNHFAHFTLHRKATKLARKGGRVMSWHASDSAPPADSVDALYHHATGSKPLTDAEILGHLSRNPATEPYFRDMSATPWVTVRRTHGVPQDPHAALTAARLPAHLQTQYRHAAFDMVAPGHAYTSPHEAMFHMRHEPTGHWFKVHVEPKGSFQWPHLGGHPDTPAYRAVERNRVATLLRRLLGKRNGS